MTVKQAFSVGGIIAIVGGALTIAVTLFGVGWKASAADTTSIVALEKAKEACTIAHEAKGVSHKNEVLLSSVETRLTSIDTSLARIERKLP